MQISSLLRLLWWDIPGRIKQWSNRLFAWLWSRDQLSVNMKTVRFWKILLAPAERANKNLVTWEFSSVHLKSSNSYGRWKLSLVSIWSSRLSRSSQSSQKVFRRSYGNATQTIANDLDDWDDLDRLDRVEFYLEDRDDHVNFEAIISKHSQTTETIKGYPRSHHFSSSNQE